MCNLLNMARYQRKSVQERNTRRKRDGHIAAGNSTDGSSYYKTLRCSSTSNTELRGAELGITRQKFPLPWGGVVYATARARRGGLAGTLRIPVERLDVFDSRHFPGDGGSGGGGGGGRGGGSKVLATTRYIILGVGGAHQQFARFVSGQIFQGRSVLPVYA